MKEANVLTQKFLRWDRGDTSAYYYYTGAHLHSLLNTLAWLQETDDND